MTRVWLWRPKMEKRENEKKRSHSMFLVWCFRVAIYLQMLLVGYAQIFLIGDFIERPWLILSVPPIIFEIIFFTHLLAIISIHSKRPFFIQLYMGIYLPFTGLGLLFIAGEETLALRTGHNLDGLAIVGTILVLALFGFPWILQMLLTYSYYQWIRDERLKEEELMNLSSPFGEDLSFAGSLLAKQKSQQNRVAQRSNEIFRQIGSSLATDPEAQTPQNFHLLTFKHTDWLPGPNLRLDLYNSLFVDNAEIPNHCHPESTTSCEIENVLFECANYDDMQIAHFLETTLITTWKITNLAFRLPKGGHFATNWNAYSRLMNWVIRSCRIKQNLIFFMSPADWTLMVDKSKRPQDEMLFNEWIRDYVNLDLFDTLDFTFSQAKEYSAEFRQGLRWRFARRKTLNN